MVQKNPPPGRNLGPKFPPHVGRSPKKILEAVLSIYKDVHGQAMNFDGMLFVRQLSEIGIPSMTIEISHLQCGP